MSKARTLANFVSSGNPLADGAIAASEVTGLSTVATTGAYNDLSGKPSLATVATSGSYNDLTNKPTITTTATNLAGGSNGTIPYQSAEGTTQMLSVGTSGQVLTSNGAAAPTWSTINAAPQITATASGSITGGAPVLLNTSGQAIAISTTNITSPTFNKVGFGGAPQNGAVAYDSKRNRIYLFWSTTTALYLNTYIATVGSSGITASLISTSTVSTTNFTAVSSSPVAAYCAGTDKLVYVVQTGSYDSYCYLGSCSDGGVTFGAGTQFSTIMTLRRLITIGNQNWVVLASGKYTADTQGVASYIDTSGVTPTITTTVFDNSNNYDFGDICYDSVNDQCVSYLGKTDNTNVFHILSNTGSSVITTITNPIAGNIRWGRLEYNRATSQIILSYSGVSSYPNARTVTSDGSTLTFNTVSVITSTGATNGVQTVVTGLGKLGSFYNSAFKIGTISGTNITYGTLVNISGFTLQPSRRMYTSASATELVFNGDEQNAAIVFAPLMSTNLTPTNFVGFAQASYTNGQTVAINTIGSTNSLQTSLTPSYAYYLSPTGAMLSANTGVYAGIATTSTKILVKG